MRNIKSLLPTEGQIQLGIIKYMLTIGAYGGKTKTMGVKRGKTFFFDLYLFTGFADLTFFYKNRILFIEVKRPGNKQSDKQKVFEKHCLDSGIQYILAYSIEDVQNELRRWKNEENEMRNGGFAGNRINECIDQRKAVKRKRSECGEKG